jgi:DNA-binding MarR family transcriptional regulator
VSGELLEARLVKREIDNSDRRGAFAVLTKKGLTTFRRAAEQHLADINNTFTPTYRSLTFARCEEP